MKSPTLGIAALSLVLPIPHCLVRGFWSILSRQSAERPCKDLVSSHGAAKNHFRNWTQDLFFCFLPPSLGGWDMEITSRRDEQGSAGPIRGTCFFHSSVSFSNLTCCGLLTLLFAISSYSQCSLCFREWCIFHLEWSKDLSLVGSGHTDKRKYV